MDISMHSSIRAKAGFFSWQLDTASFGSFNSANERKLKFVLIFVKFLALSKNLDVLILIEKKNVALKK